MHHRLGALRPPGEHVGVNDNRSTQKKGI
jgi:hypothetical protein